MISILVMALTRWTDLQMLRPHMPGTLRSWRFMFQAVSALWICTLMMNLLSTTSPYSTDDRRLLYVFYYCLSAVIEGLLDNKGSAWRGNPMIIFTMISSSNASSPWVWELVTVYSKNLEKRYWRSLYSSQIALKVREKVNKNIRNHAFVCGFFPLQNLSI